MGASKTHHIIEGMSTRHVYVLASYYYDRLTQQQIGATLGLTQQRTSQLLAEGLELIERAGLPSPAGHQAQRQPMRYFDVRVLSKQY